MKNTEINQSKSERPKIPPWKMEIIRKLYKENPPGAVGWLDNFIEKYIAACKDSRTAKKFPTPPCVVWQNANAEVAQVIALIVVEGLGKK